MNSGDESQCPRPLERHGVYLAAPGPAQYPNLLAGQYIEAQPVKHIRELRRIAYDEVATLDAPRLRPVRWRTDWFCRRGLLREREVLLDALERNH